MVGYAVKKLRQSLGLTQKELAARIGVQQNTVSQYESGKIIPSPAVVLHLWQMSQGSDEEALFQSIRDDPKYAFQGRDDQPPAEVAPEAVAAADDWFYGEHRAYIDAAVEQALAALAGKGGDARQLQFLNLMRRFFAVADRDTIAIVESLAATRVRQHEREVQKRKEEGRKTG